ncbi:Protein angel 2, partial [Mortierella alpina]
YDADIICFQELDDGDYNGTFGRAMGTLGYAGVYGKRKASLEHGFGVFYKTSRVAFVRECTVAPLDGAFADDVETPGVMVVLDIEDGERKRRVCVASTHVICSSDRGFAKLQQVMALLAAARGQMLEDPAMAFVMAGDFNALPEGLLIQYVLSGSVDLGVMAEAAFSRETLAEAEPADQSHLERAAAFKLQTRGLRDVSIPSTFASLREEIRAAVTLSKEQRDLVVAHPLRMFSAYTFSQRAGIVDFLFHGRRMGGPRLEIVARLELPERLARLKAGLPAGHLSSDHFALGAKYRFNDERLWVDLPGPVPDYERLFATLD